MNYDEMMRVSDQHARNPMIGDVWRDHFVPVFLVIDVGQYHVVLIDKVRDVDGTHWEWDDTAISTMTRAQFNERVRYRGLPGGSTSVVADKCWCECSDRGGISISCWSTAATGANTSHASLKNTSMTRAGRICGSWPAVAPTTTVGETAKSPTGCPCRRRQPYD